VVSPAPPEETLLVATIDHRRVLEERQNFDPAGYDARPDVTLLTVNRKGQNLVILTD